MRKLVILGGGISGIGAALLAKKNGYDVFVSDKSIISEKEVLTNNDIKWEEGTHSIKEIMTASEVVKSPGIPNSVDLIKIFFYISITTRAVPVNARTIFFL